ncbi:hypothetical protein Bca4012_026893 [Brassica carinata]
MKQCDHHLAIASSSLPFTASESDPEDSFWRDFFDFSFLTSDDQKSGLDDGSSELYIVDSNVSMVEERSPPRASVLGVTTTSTTPVAKNDSIAKKGKEACFSPLFAKISALRIKECPVPSDLYDTEVDSPCWKGAVSRNIAESGTSSVNLRRSRDDLNVLYGLNPMAPQFIPSTAKMNLDRSGKEFEGSSLKRSLSSTFPPSSGEFSINDLYEAGSDQKISIGVMDQSLGLVSQDSVSEAMGILDISHEFQRPKKLDPLAPVFVPAYTVVHEKSVVAERNAHSTYASSEVGHIGSSNPYSDNVHQSGKTYSSNPRLGSQVQKKKLNPLAPQFSLPDTKPKVYGGSVENQAPPTNVNSSVLFSPVSYKELHAGFAHPSVHVEPSYKEVDSKQMGPHRSFISHGNPSPQMDVKKLLTTIHGLSELLTHVHGSDTSASPNEQDLHLINSTVQNLNSYINNQAGNYDGLTSLPNIYKQSIREHQIPKARNLSSTVDFRRKEKYPMVKGETGTEVPFENSFGQTVVRNHETEEQINPQRVIKRHSLVNGAVNGSSESNQEAESSEVAEKQESENGLLKDVDDVKRADLLVEEVQEDASDNGISS